MGQVLIRNLDDAILTDYRRAAREKGRSLEAELRDVLVQSRPKPAVLVGDELRALCERLWADTPDSAAAVDSGPYIQSMRDDE